MQMLRHSKIAIIMGFYTEVTSAAMRDALKKLGQWLGTVILATYALAMRRSKLRLKLRGSIGVPWRVVNTKPESSQAFPAR
jgi:hypothetical protein